MICISDLQQLINNWTERMGNFTYPLSYRDALSECIYELNQFINHAIDEELTYQDYLQLQADDYLAAIEQQEQIA